MTLGMILYPFAATTEEYNILKQLQQNKIVYFALGMLTCFLNNVFTITNLELIFIFVFVCFVFLCFPCLHLILKKQKFEGEKAGKVRW
jgi:hypothetical protein